MFISSLFSCIAAALKRCDSHWNDFQVDFRSLSLSVCERCVTFDAIQTKMPMQRKYLQYTAIWPRTTSTHTDALTQLQRDSVNGSGRFWHFYSRALSVYCLLHCWWYFGPTLSRSRCLSCIVSVARCVCVCFHVSLIDRYIHFVSLPSTTSIKSKECERERDRCC